MAFESGQNLAKNTIEAGVNAASQAVKLTMGLGSFFRTTSSSSANIPSKTVIEAGAFQEKDIPLPHSSTPSIILSSLIPTSLFSKQIHSTPSVSESSSIDAESPSHNPDSQKQQQKQQQLPESSEIFKDQVDFELSNDQQVAGIDFYSPAAAAATVAKQQEITETEVVLDEEIPPLSGDKPEPSWYPWLIAGSVLVAGAAGAYYVGAGSVVYGVVASSYVRSAASSAASTAAIYVANEVSRHLQFLYPLYGTKEQLASRVRKVSEAAEQEKLVFGCLYVQVRK